MRISLPELLVIGFILVLIFGTKRLSGAARRASQLGRAGWRRVWVTNPVTRQQEFTLMTVSKEIAIGRQSDAEVRQKWGIYGDQALQQYVDEIGHKLTGASHRPDLPWHFTIVDDAAPNAFAAPGGYVYITRGLMAYLNDEAELATVLGHEMGHVTARHTARLYTREHGVQAGLWLAKILWPAARPVGGLANKGLDLLLLSYGRDAELEADRLSVEYAARSGWDPAGLPRILTTLARIHTPDGSDLVNWLSSHPPASERVAELQDNVDTLQKRARETRRDHYRRRIQGLAFGDNPGDRMDFHAVRAGDTWESIAQRVCHGRVAATTLAIMNGYPVKKPPSADDQIKIIVGA